MKTQLLMKTLYPSMLLSAAVLLGGCVEQPKTPARLGLKLPPAELGASINLQQQLSVEREGRTDHLDAALEIDEDHVGLIGLAMGQRVMSIDYDGKELKTWRHALLPAQVRGEDVLEDIQLTYWPVESIRAALPAGWRIEDQGMRRTLWSGDMQVMTIDYTAEPRWGGKVQLTNFRYHYRLSIQSVLIGQ